MKRELSEHIQLEDIVIDVADTVLYLETLWQVLTQHYPELPTLRTRIEELLGHVPVESVAKVNAGTATRTIGYYGDTVAALIDREWQDYPLNECDVLFDFLVTRRFLESANKVFLWGVGTCRLGDYLASLDTVTSVTCTDLSWLTLYFGKLLCESRLHALPEPSRRDRPFYQVSANSCELLLVTQPSRFRHSKCTEVKRSCIQYCVRDALSVGATIEADLFILPYFLDNFEGPRLASALIRICQQIQIGQKLLIVVSCYATVGGQDSRHPVRIVDTLKRFGFRMERVELSELPYSFFYYSFGMRRSEHMTLVLLAERVSDPPFGSVSISASAPPEWLRERDLALHESDSLVLSLCQEGASYDNLLMTEKLSRHACERSITSLLARGMVKLTIT